jgi:hypothetical protein
VQEDPTYDPGKVVHEMAESLSRQWELRSELIRLQALEVAAKSSGYIFAFIVLVTLGFFTVVFVSVLIALALSQWLQSYVYGFGIVAVLYLVSFLLFLINHRKWLVHPMANQVIQTMQSDSDGQGQ